MSAELALQGALVAALKTSPAGAAVSGRVYDRIPAKTDLPYLHLRSFQAVDDRADCVEGLEVYADLDVWSDAVGKPEASRIAGLVRDALHLAPLTLAAPWVLLEIEHRDTTTDGSEPLLVRARLSFRALVERV
ncbi:DUF3168 domain-containing protein [Methylobacterium nodulans]|uniref:Gene transfer agent n=1 Tax=Methylobacterium nodulans (strain LMG 21967 / CNCM I-2342 / ORS 2060) TaxID=460265 RepID=B8IE23_METNO|nr:DUF3168 domain-containing protein [Methylobacterium nodulans]ACL57569.1 gene transfer agent [Methylobacterium nodulans ORS 2060]